MLDWLHPYRPYYQKFTRFRRMRVSGRFSLRLAQHLLFRPCRRGLPDLTDQERERSLYNALYDAMFSLILSGYKRLAKQELHADTKRVLFLIRRWMRQVDNEFERCIAAKEQPELDKIYAAEAVAFARKRALAFAEQFDCRQNIDDAIEAFLSSHFERYLETVGQTMEEADVDQAMEMVRLDSGLWLQTMIECVRIFNNHPADARTDRSFVHLGIAGTLADDLLDVGFDLQDGDSNVLVAILRNEPEEYQRMLDAGPGVGALGATWWRKNCPRAYRRLFALIELHQCQIESRHLQTTTDLMLVPATFGYDYKRAIRNPPTQ